MNILFIGDIVGGPGRKVAKSVIPSLRKELCIDYCIANCENAAGGSGITYVVAQDLYNCGIDVITMGNHTWSKKEILNFIDQDNRIVRPANYPLELPGRGSVVYDGKIGIINVMGRVYMESLDCPFKACDREIELLKPYVKIIIIDVHAEASSEKNALAWYVDGRVSCVFGTHTHVQTADERILPCGTAFITDVGMTGPSQGIIGVDKDIIINKFITHMPAKFEIARGECQINAVVAEIDDKTGKTERIERINKNVCL